MFKTCFYSDQLQFFSKISFTSSRHKLMLLTSKKERNSSRLVDYLKSHSILKGVLSVTSV